jgi:uncharacterized membrane protein YjfL (UPF0719 family)
MPESDFFVSSAINISINLVYTVTVLVIAVVALKYIDAKLLKSIELEEEIKKGNVAAAIFASTVLIFIAIIVASSMH